MANRMETIKEDYESASQFSTRIDDIMAIKSGDPRKGKKQDDRHDKYSK